ncbi:MAG: YidH family protein [Iamia sp.]
MEAPPDPDRAAAGPDGARAPDGPPARRSTDRPSGVRERLFPEDPRRVGDEPDYRFTLANERTFLAWIRTALALAAGGLGSISLLEDYGGSQVLGIGLLALSFLTAASAYRRWAHSERSMRLGMPLPSSRLPMMMAVGTAVVAVVAAVMLIVDRT